MTSLILAYMRAEWIPGTVAPGELRTAAHTGGLASRRVIRLWRTRTILRLDAFHRTLAGAGRPRWSEIMGDCYTGLSPAMKARTWLRIHPRCRPSRSSTKRLAALGIDHRAGDRVRWSACASGGDDTPAWPDKARRAPEPGQPVTESAAPDVSHPGRRPRASSIADAEAERPRRSLKTKRARAHAATQKIHCAPVAYSTAARSCRTFTGQPGAEQDGYGTLVAKNR